MIGIDYASVDGNRAPDWSKAKAAGCRFVIIRGAYGMYRDPAFVRDWDKIRAAGIIRGAYLFPQYPRPGTVAPGTDKQAMAFAETVGDLEKSDIVPMVDIEFSSDVKKETGLTPQQMMDWVGEIISSLSSIYGAMPGIYTSARVFSEPLHGVLCPQFADCPLWVKGVGGTKYESPYIVATRKPAILKPTFTAQPNTPPSWAGQWWVNQYQGDSILFPGFSSTVDINKFNVLAKGATGETVKWMQRRIGRTPTGVFDSALETAIKNFQSHNSLIADGIVGPATFARISWCSGVECPT